MKFLFERRRNGRGNAHDVVSAPSLPTEEAAPETARGEQEQNTGQLGDPGKVDTLLGEGSKVTGELVFEETAQIEGQVEGEISAHDTLIIGESAAVNGKISGTSIIIGGRVTGDVTARQRLELRAASRVQGNVTTPSLVVHEGAFLEGQCSVCGTEGGRIAREARSERAGQLRVLRSAPN